MPRITADNPSDARPLLIAMVAGTTWQTLAEAPDFSVPDTRLIWPSRDPTDDTRGIRPGEVFLLTPIKARNTDVATRWVELALRLESGSLVVMERVFVPAGDTAMLVTQGLSLMKRTPSSSNGDRLQIRAEVPSVFNVSGAAEERPSSEHLGVV